MVYYVSTRLLEYVPMSEDSSLGGDSLSVRALKGFDSRGEQDQDWMAYVRAV